MGRPRPLSTAPRRWQPLVAWLIVLGACSWYPGAAVLSAFYCGSDWEAPCESHTATALLIVAMLVMLPLVAALVAALRYRARWVLVQALAVAPLQLWFFLGYGLPTAANSSV